MYHTPANLGYAGAGIGRRRNERNCPHRPEAALHVRRSGDPDSHFRRPGCLSTPTDIFPNMNVDPRGRGRLDL